MKQKRLEKIGIQRELHPKWFDFAAGLAATGTKKLDARRQIYDYLGNAPGLDSPTDQTRIYITNPLVKTWIAPDKDLIPLRDRALELWKYDQASAMLLHWALLSAAYPFWFRCSEFVGRLLDLQFQATQGQIVRRLKEVYGDRQTISRRARYIIRSFITWRLLEDASHLGVYKEAQRLKANEEVSAILLESALWTFPQDRVAMSILANHPAFYPFEMLSVSARKLAEASSQIETLSIGIDEDILQLATPNG